jgi:hypothetical protein
MRTLLISLIVVNAIITMPAQNSNTSNNDYNFFLHNPALFTQTVHQLNTVVMGNNFSPMVASRNYVYAAIAAYEVIAKQNPTKYNSLSGQLSGLGNFPDPDPNNQIDYELAALLAYINIGETVTFPTGSLKEYKDSLLVLSRKKGLPQDIEIASQKYAETISSIVIAWSKKDNYKETRTARQFELRDDDSRWIPTPPGYFEAVEPNWGTIRLLAIDSVTAFKVPPPPIFNVKDTGSQYYNEIMLLLKMSDSLNAEQKHIANFWDDNPFKVNVKGHIKFPTKKFSPPGHWMSICGIAAAKSNADFATNVYATALTSISIFDAFIECFYIKYKYANVRPETVINKFFRPNWKPLLQTPAFPEYTCGHATISAAAGEALTKVYGDNFAYLDTTEEEFGIKSRSFTSFRQAALENVNARFYGGIHFHNSCKISNQVGVQIGNIIVNKLTMKIK